jgi:Putative ABC exporter
MNRALSKLILMLTKASLRRAFRGARSFKGAFLVIFTLFVLGSMIAPSVIGAVFLSRPSLHPFVVSAFEPYLPLLLFAGSLLIIFGPAGETAISFAPAEVDLLFPAPFRRFELLVYKVVKLLLGSLFLALICSLSFLIYVPSWSGAFVGIFLTLVFTQLISLAAGLVGQIASEHAYTRARKAVLYGVAALLAAGLAQIFFQTPIQSIPELAQSLRGSWTGRVVLSPFEVFSHTILANEFFPDLVCWGAGAAAIDLALLVLVLKLDADYIEGAAAVSQKLYERLQRARQHGGFSPAPKSAGRLRLRCLPWLGGMGPLAWRTMLTAMRTARSVIIAFFGLGAVFLVASLVLPQGHQAAGFLPTVGVGLLAYLTFIFTLSLPWAFRGDLDHIDFLKSLPVRPIAVATGELAGAVVLLAATQFLLLAGLFVTGAGTGLIASAAAFAIPFDLVMLTTSNVVFLLFPIRLARSTTPDLQVFGRAMLSFLLQFLVLVPTLGVPAAAGALAFYLSDASLPVFVLVAWIVLAAEIPLFLFALGVAFDRFDPAMDMPT